MNIDETLRAIVREELQPLAAELRQLTKKAGPAPTPTDKEIWTIADVAAELRRSVSWVKQLVRAGNIPFIRIPGARGVRFESAAVRAWWKTRREEK